MWIEPVSKGEFDVALGARVISKEAGGRIQVNGLFFGENDHVDGDDDNLPRAMSKEAGKIYRLPCYILR